jgi:acetylornithine deacetylase/succinyl-diaminopimelate desuccinylase-like protein
MPFMKAHLTGFAAALALVAPATAPAQTYPAAEAQALDLSRDTIALRSVQGEGNRTAEVAQAFRRALVAGGWAERDIEIVPVDDTAYLIATWPGSDPSLGPVVISAHMDVVEARPEDWERDPFTPVVENGFIYGRGASDTKFEASLAVASLIELRRQGFRPRRPIVVAYSGDEETTMKTSKLIAARLKNAHIVLNVDGASGLLSEETGEPLYWTWQGAEKTYIDFRLEATNPGGHSSAPRPDNAIAQLAQAIGRIAAYRFAPELNDITKAYFEQVAAIQPDPELARAMRAFAADPADAAAIELLRGDTILNGVIGTTCVPTLVEGGHAPNALPQRATAVVNCRVFPGHDNREIQAELERVAATPAVVFTDITGDTSIASPPSPLRPEFVAAFEKAVRAAWGDVPIYPAQSSGASDSMWYRALGVPSYGASASFIRESDEFSHGLNERMPLSNIRPGITYYLTVLRELASR